MKTHLRTRCAKSIFKCTFCKITKTRSELPTDDHSCELNLLKAAEQSESDLLKIKLIEQLTDKSKS
jgi:hypothetical protein